MLDYQHFIENFTMKNFFILYLFLAMTSNVSAQKSPKKLQNKMEEIHLKIGKSKNLQFKSLSTAGYSWEFKQEKEGILEIKPVPAKLEEPKNPPIVGVSPDEIFKIKAVAKGKTHLNFSKEEFGKKTFQP